MAKLVWLLPTSRGKLGEGNLTYGMLVIAAALLRSIVQFSASATEAEARIAAAAKKYWPKRPCRTCQRAKKIDNRLNMKGAGGRRVDTRGCIKARVLPLLQCNLNVSKTNV
jgi:hypothetical protein